MDHDPWGLLLVSIQSINRLYKCNFKSQTFLRYAPNEQSLTIVCLFYRGVHIVKVGNE